MYYDTIDKEWHTSRQTLPKTRGSTSGLRRADTATLLEHGIYSNAVEDPTPEGMIRTGWELEAVFVEGVPHRIPVCITQEERAQQKLQAAMKQAQSDVKEYRLQLLAIAGLAQAVPTINAGDEMPAITQKVAAARVAAKGAGNTILDGQIEIAQDMAMLAWTATLKPDMVTGDRLWMALGVLAQGGQ